MNLEIFNPSRTKRVSHFQLIQTQSEAYHIFQQPKFSNVSLTCNLIKFIQFSLPIASVCVSSTAS
jgi:hypothetical protein